MNRWTRQLHRWGSVVVGIPLLVIIVSGILLQVKKQVPWVQPPTKRGEASEPVISWKQILDAVSRVPEAEVAGWKDIERLDVQVGKGVLKVQCKNRWEVQLDSASGQVLYSTYRRSDLIESLHDGSWFGGDGVKLGIFLPTAIVLFGLWVTGAYLFFLPILKRRMNRQSRAKRRMVA